ncbi:MAG: ATP-dependent DNA ligase [Actinomycetota bacterium]
MTLLIPRSTKPMLAKLATEIPTGAEWLYEPKWDGFRALVFRDGDDLEIISRDGKPLHRYLPELVPVLSEDLPRRCVVDGEVVITGPKGLDFDALLMRIHPARSRIERLAQEVPASFVAFDILAVKNRSVTEKTTAERRDILVDQLDVDEGLPELARRSQMLVTSQTDDVVKARSWFDELEAIGLDGVIAKRRDLPYAPGKRTMVKIKHVRTADCVIGGYRLSKDGDGVGSLLLGLYVEGVLHYVGHTSSFKAQERRDLLKKLAPLEGGHSFGEGRSPGGPSRWSGGRDVSWVSLEPSLVCEVAFEKLQGERFRHAARFLRWRPDRKPESCTFDQVDRRLREG